MTKRKESFGLGLYRLTAMEKEDLPMWKCVNLVLKPWELVIASADTVHFGSRYPNESICNSKKFNASVSYRLHHYLGSQLALRSEEENRSSQDDCAFNPQVQKGRDMIETAMPNSTVVSRKFQNCTFDLRTNADMAPALRKLERFPNDVPLYPMYK